MWGGGELTSRTGARLVRDVDCMAGGGSLGGSHICHPPALALSIRSLGMEMRRKGVRICIQGNVVMFHPPSY